MSKCCFSLSVCACVCVCKIFPLSQLCSYVIPYISCPRRLAKSGCREPAGGPCLLSTCLTRGGMGQCYFLPVSQLLAWAEHFYYLYLIKFFSHCLGTLIEAARDHRGEGLAHTARGSARICCARTTAARWWYVIILISPPPLCSFLEGYLTKKINFPFKCKYNFAHINEQLIFSMIMFLYLLCLLHACKN